MSAQHTPGPWNFMKSTVSKVHILAGDGFHIATCHADKICGGSSYLANALPNARRIVACVNACAGISDEMLADDCFNKMREDRDQLLVQRDELLAAAVAVVDRWDSPQWKDPHTGEFINKLRKAITKAAA